MLTLYAFVNNAVGIGKENLVTVGVYGVCDADGVIVVVMDGDDVQAVTPSNRIITGRQPVRRFRFCLHFHLL
jgi:hypothetical protein